MCENPNMGNRMKAERKKKEKSPLETGRQYVYLARHQQYSCCKRAWKIMSVSPTIYTNKFTRLFLSSRPPQTMAYLRVSIPGGQCLCVYTNLLPKSIHVCNICGVSMSYSKLWNYIYIYYTYIYIYIYV